GSDAMQTVSRLLTIRHKLFLHILFIQAFGMIDNTETPLPPIQHDQDSFGLICLGRTGATSISLLCQPSVPVIRVGHQLRTDFGNAPAYAFLELTTKTP